ncbi:alpha/beta hydrolase-fold protein [soil metagenome]
MSKIRFQIVPPIQRSDETVFITGGLPSLGNWQPSKAIPLRWEPPFHVGEIEADLGSHFEYKITRGSWETEAVDAYGDVPPNSPCEVWLDHTIRHTVADWKDRYRGRLTRERIPSRALADARDVLIWLPPSYSTETFRRFPIVVLHDGANVFDPTTSPLSGVDWAADEWITLLASEGVLPEAIVVGICQPEGFAHGDVSLRDYDLSPEWGGPAYAEFVAAELVPYLDSRYRTLADPRARILGGSSLGGLLSFYLAMNHPGVFTSFACLSTSFEDVSQSPPLHSGQLLALEAAASLPTGLRMYFDYGTHGLDECYDPYHLDLASFLRAKGWQHDREFKIVKVEGGTHEELSWRQRFGNALRFLAS